MSLNSHTDPVQTLSLNGATVTIKKITPRQFLRLLDMVRKVRNDLGVSQKELEETQLDKAGVTALISRLLKACLSAPLGDNGQPTGAAFVALSTVADLLKVTVDDLLDADFDDLYLVAETYWEVNGNGPLGQKIRSIIAGLMPMIEMAKDTVMLGFHQELTKGLRVGGTDDGGMIGFSSPSTESFDGPKDTSSTSSHSPESSSSSSLSDITDGSLRLPTAEELAAMAESPPAE